jgi:hypothetical protein
MNKEELKKQMSEVLSPVGPEEWLIERCCDVAELYARSTPPTPQGSAVWVKASDRLPEKGGWYFVKAGPDKATWPRKKLVARTELLKNENAENHIEWLDESNI